MAHDYYLVKWGRVGRGIGPLLPRGVGFLEMADPGLRSRWALYRCDRVWRLGRVMRWLPERLWLLLSSGDVYPPALALARNDARRLARRRPRMTATRFIHAYAA